MSSWSTLRRTSPTFHLQQIRQFSAHAPPPGTTTFLNSSTTNNNVRTNFLRWISAGIITSSALALALHSCSSSSLPSTSPSLAFADCSTTPLTTTTGPTVPSHQSKFLFGDAYRRKIFFNYEKRIRMRSPPEKVLLFFFFFFKDMMTIRACRWLATIRCNRGTKIYETQIK
ncbi:calcium uptake protein, mitochondrial-like [Olea europaea var. sylvestris]|uniref:calcium uptake protein, mitochondrial-like n=1 Tax=Olea europaea var. sylvestris TaxID=158386 RepID=UPI000C1D0232|nr:calcium uptake protein, mitochondrial-like [Olea europaea var. sylvestris]